MAHGGMHRLMHLTLCLMHLAALHELPPTLFLFYPHSLPSLTPFPLLHHFALSSYSPSPTFLLSTFYFLLSTFYPLPQPFSYFTHFFPHPISLSNTNSSIRQAGRLPPLEVSKDKSACKHVPSFVLCITTQSANTFT